MLCRTHVAERGGPGLAPRGTRRRLHMKKGILAAALGLLLFRLPAVPVEAASPVLAPQRSRQGGRRSRRRPGWSPRRRAVALGTRTRLGLGLARLGPGLGMGLSRLRYYGYGYGYGATAIRPLPVRVRTVPLGRRGHGRLARRSEGLSGRQVHRPGRRLRRLPGLPLPPARPLPARVPPGGLPSRSSSR